MFDDDENDDNDELYLPMWVDNSSLKVQVILLKSYEIYKTNKCLIKFKIWIYIYKKKKKLI